MVRLTSQNFFKVSDGSVFVVAVLLNSFSKTEVSVNAFGVNFDRMFKIFCSSLPFTHISK